MKSLFKNRIFITLAGLILFFILSGSITFAQAQSDEDLKKKYAPIIGEYEFDLTSMGGEVQYVTFHVIDGELWADSGDGDPATMEPVEGAEFEFKAVGSDGQEFEINFVKNDQGQYTICKIFIVMMDMEVEGIKKDK